MYLELLNARLDNLVLAGLASRAHPLRCLEIGPVDLGIGDPTWAGRPDPGPGGPKSETMSQERFS